MFLGAPSVAASAGLAVAALAVLYTVLHSLYCLLLHPLRRFPGPWLAAVSHTWYAYHWMAGRYPWDIEALHARYGDVVRIAPNELSFASAASFNDIYGHANKDRAPFIKAQFYEHPQPEPGIVAERDPDKHRDIRKALSHGFSARALQSQDETVDAYVRLFVDQLARICRGGRPVNVKEWFNWLAFDIVGELAFGESFGSVRAAQSHFWIDTIHDGAFLVCLFEIGRRLPLAWPLILFCLPSGIRRKFDTFLEFSKLQVRARVARQGDAHTRNDFFAGLLNSKQPGSGGDSSPEQPPRSEEWLIAQANVLVIAGSDTTATALTTATYLLLRHPDQLRELQNEVRSAFASSADIDSTSVQSLRYLNAVIEESLRVFPPTAFGLPRISPGAFVDGVHVPRGTTVSTSSWTTTHAEKHFYKAREFHPERWLPADDARYSHEFDKDDKAAARPFSLGPRGCLGVNLAYLELRKVLAHLAWTFDWKLLNDEQIDWDRDAKFEGFWQIPAPRVTFERVDGARRDSGVFA